MMIKIMAALIVMQKSFFVFVYCIYYILYFFVNLFCICIYVKCFKGRNLLGALSSSNVTVTGGTPE